VSALSSFEDYVISYKERRMVKELSLAHLLFFPATKTTFSARMSLRTSGQYMYRTVVNICTAQWSLYVPHSGHYIYDQCNIQQLYVLPTQCTCFVWISEQTAIISLYNIN